MNQFHGQNFYEILEVHPGANQEEVYRAFHKAKATYSPNSPAMYSIFSKEEASELIKLIEEAYSVLSDPARRREYDLKILESQTAYPDLAAQAKNTQSPIVEGEFGNLLPDVAAMDSAHANAIPSATSTYYDSAKPTLPPTAAPAYASSPVPPVSAQSRPEFTGSGMTTAAPGGMSSGNAGGVPEKDPSKFGKTRFSQYELDLDFEVQIKNQDIFDGSFLAKVRNYKRVTIDQLSETSRIGRHYLIAVENNDIPSLPAAVFVRGFIVQYAKVLDLDEKKVVNSYMKLLNDSRTR